MSQRMKLSVYGENFTELFQEKLSGCAKEILGSMAYFQKELVKHLDEITVLNDEIARRNPSLAMKLSDFMKDICHVYYDNNC